MCVSWSRLLQNECGQLQVCRGGSSAKERLLAQLPHVAGRKQGCRVSNSDNTASLIGLRLAA